MKLWGLVFVLILLIPVSSATKTVSFDQKITYLDFNGIQRIYDNTNLTKYPMYFIEESASEYTITRQGESFKLKKSEADYDFQVDRIIPSSKNLNGKRPFILSYDTNIFKQKENSLKSNKWTWNIEAEISDDFVQTEENGRKERIETIKGNVANGKITYNIPEWVQSFREHTIIVDNATTNGFSNSNIILTNTTRDLSGSNVSIGYWYDTFSDGIIASQYLSSSGATENSNNNTLSITQNGYLKFLTFINDSFNASISVKSMQNGSASTDSPVFYYNFQNSDPTNRSGVSIRATNLSKNEVNFKSIQNSVNGNVYNHNETNNFKINTYGTTTQFFINGALDSTLTHANVSAVKAVSDSVKITTVNSIGEFRNLRLWNNRNNVGLIQILNNTGLHSDIVNRTKVIIYNTNSNLTVDLYTKPGNTSSYTLLQANISNDTWVNIPANIQSTSQDFLIVLNGNATDSPVFNSLIYDTQMMDMLQGAIKNDKGQPISGVNVIVSGINVATTDANGYYNTGFIFLDNNTYEVSFSYPHYKFDTTLIKFNTGYIYTFNDPPVMTIGGYQQQSQTSINNYAQIAFPIMGLLLMIYGFCIILSIIKNSEESNMSGSTLLSSITFIIIGFGLIVLGNYLYWAIVNFIPQLP